MTITISKLKALKTVKATRINHGLNESARNEWIKQVIEGLLEQGANPETKENKIFCNNGQWFTIPALQETFDCELQFRSDDYICHYNDKKSYGSIPKKETITETGFFVNDFKDNKIITYIIHI